MSVLHSRIITQPVNNMSKVHVFENNDSDSGSGPEADVESDAISEGGIESEDGENKKSGMADAMARILGKKVPSKKGVIMAKAMTDKQIERKRRIKEQGGKEEDTETKRVYIDQQTRQAKKKEWENQGRVKPDPLEKPAERVLQRIATRGVVQLFNAVRQQQKILDEQLTEAGSSERRKDKVVESMTKGKFLDILKGTSDVKSQPSKTKIPNKLKSKKSSYNHNKDTEEDNPKWSILRDDFMMGATMKDWDKEGSDGEELPDD